MFTHDPSSQVSCLLLFPPSQNALSVILVSDNSSFEIGQSSVMSGLSNAVLGDSCFLTSSLTSGMYCHSSLAVE